MSTNVTRVLVCLEEVGAEYEPFGQIPAFQDGDVVLFEQRLTLHFDSAISESRAIARYVLRKYNSADADLLREGNLKEAAMVDVWTEVEAHQYYPAISPVVYECLINPIMRGVPTNQNAVDDALEKLRKVLDVYEARLSKSTTGRNT
ncbi:hypothetical protein EJB05_30441, partial [Eragrostis curvula]